MTTRQTFGSKIGITFVVPVAAMVMVVIGTLSDIWKYGTVAEIAIHTLLSGSLVVFCLWLACTRYSIDHQRLVVRSGPFRWKIPLATIVSVESTHGFVSAPALAMDRLEVGHAKGCVVISPRRKRAFVNALARAVAEAGGRELDVSKVR